MSNKIEGVPEGWKIKKYDFLEVGDFKPVYKDGRWIACKVIESDKGFLGSPDLILERDIKIIDMSKCKVDIQKAKKGEPWVVDEWVYQESLDLDGFSTRVRQNHYFGWEGGECPLPEGLLIRATFTTPRNDGLHTYSIDAISHELKFDNQHLIGFEVKRPCAGYAYKHEIEGGEV